MRAHAITDTRKNRDTDTHTRTQTDTHAYHHIIDSVYVFHNLMLFVYFEWRKCTNHKSTRRPGSSCAKWQRAFALVWQFRFCTTTTLVWQQKLPAKKTLLPLCKYIFPPTPRRNGHAVNAKAVLFGAARPHPLAHRWRHQEAQPQVSCVGKQLPAHLFYRDPLVSLLRLWRFWAPITPIISYHYSATLLFLYNPPIPPKPPYLSF